VDVFLARVIEDVSHRQHSVAVVGVNPERARRDERRRSLEQVERHHCPATRTGLVLVSKGRHLRVVVVLQSLLCVRQSL
jgi:hypothetical protein